MCFDGHNFRVNVEKRKWRYLMDSAGFGGSSSPLFMLLSNDVCLLGEKKLKRSISFISILVTIPF